MSAVRRYQFAFFALGWLIAVAVLFQIGFGSGFQVFYRRISDSMTRVAQFFSERQSEAMQRASRGSRRDSLAPMRSVLESPQALRKPPALLFGAYDGGLPNTFAGLEKFESQVQYRFPIISFYQPWGDRPSQQFPRGAVETISRMGSVPLITWEPWLTEFDERSRRSIPPVAERDFASLKAVARGDYDFFISAWARAAAGYGKPLFLRFAQQMNDPYRYPWGPQNGNRPEDFIAAWRHIYLIFQKMKATNVLWVWSPQISMPWFEYYYPGDEFVDWIGISVLNYGDVANWSRWWSFQQILDKSYPALLKLKKPIMISELGTVAVGGDTTEWYRQAFYHIENTYRRGIRAVVFYNQPRDTTMSMVPLNWTIGQSPRSTALVAGQLAGHSAM